jgi:hypothetical protein
MKPGCDGMVSDSQKAEIQTDRRELKAVHWPDALALATMRKWSEHFREGRTDLSDNPRSGWPLTHNLAEVIRSVFREQLSTLCKVLCRDFLISTATCLRIPHNNFGLKNSIFVGSKHSGPELEE